MDYVICGGELYHHGVKGMKWGVRKAKEKYKSEKKRLRSAEKDLNKAAWRGFGMKGIQNYEKVKKKTTAIATDTAMARAKYKSSKYEDSKKAAKAEMKSYIKSFRKTGLPDSAADTSGRSRALYDRLKTEKGKKYADTVVNKYQKRLVTEIVASAVVAVGAGVASAMLQNQ